MATRKGVFADFYLDGYVLHTGFRSLSVETIFDEIEGGAFNVNAKAYGSGRGDGVISGEGYFDQATGGTHAALQTVATDKVSGVAFGNNAVPTQGDIAVGMPVHQLTYPVNSDLDGLIAVSANLKSIGTIPEWGNLIARVANATATSNTTSIDQTASSSNGGSGYLFLHSVSPGDTITVVIEDSPDDAIWTPLITFTLDGSAIGGERLTVTGTVDRYIRVQYTISGTSPSFDFAVIFKRN